MAARPTIRGLTYLVFSPRGSRRHSTAPKRVRIAVVGGGLRGSSNTMFIHHSIAAVNHYAKQHCLKLPRTTWEIVNFHAGPEESYTQGPAWSVLVDAAINRDIPPPTPVPDFEEVSFTELHRLIDPAAVTKRAYRAGSSQMLRRAQQTSVPMAALITSKTDEDGNIDTTLASLPRGAVGAIQTMATTSARKRPVSGCTISVRHNTEVAAWDPKGDTDLTLLLKENGKPIKPEPFDIVLVCTGLNPHHVIPAQIVHKAYVGDCNREEVLAYLGTLGGLDNNGNIKPDFPIGLVGTGLSGIDFSNLLGTLMGCFTYDKQLPANFTVDGAAITSRQSQIKSLNRITGDVPTTRYFEDRPWSGSENALVTACQNFAMRASRGYDHLTAYRILAWFNACITLGQAPANFFPDAGAPIRSSKEVLVEDLAAVDKFIAGGEVNEPHTHRSLLHRAFYLLFEGYGFETDRPSEDRRFRKIAPHIGDHWQGWRAYRTVGYDATRDPDASNTSAMKAYAEGMKFIAASPPHIHKGMCELAKHNVVAFHHGDAQAITYNTATRNFTFPDGTTVKALIAPMQLRSGDGGFWDKSVVPNVRNTAGVAKLKHGRHPVTQCGKPILFIDYSNSGTGKTLKQPDGSNTRYGLKWNDISVAAPISEGGPSLAAGIISLGFEITSDSPNPADAIAQRRRAAGPTEKQINAEMANFKNEFDAAVRHVAWAKLLLHLPHKNDAAFMRLALVTSKEERNTWATKIQQHNPDHAAACDEYLDCNATNPYNPPTPKQFDQEYLDLTPNSASAILKSTLSAHCIE